MLREKCDGGHLLTTVVKSILSSASCTRANVVKFAGDDDRSECLHRRPPSSYVEVGDDDGARPSCTAKIDPIRFLKVTPTGNAYIRDKIVSGSSAESRIRESFVRTDLTRLQIST